MQLVQQQPCFKLLKARHFRQLQKWQQRSSWPWILRVRNLMILLLSRIPQKKKFHYQSRFRKNLSIDSDIKLRSFDYKPDSKMLLISDLPGMTIPRVLLSQILPQMIMVETMIIMKKKIPKIQKKVAQQYIIFFIFLLSYSLLFWFSDLNKCRQLGRRLPWVSLFLFL